MTTATVQMDASLPPRERWEAINEHCPMARLLDVIGNRSAFLILREAFYGATRFEQFAARAGISEPIASARLRELTSEGLLEKVPYREPGQRTRHEYRLTEKGTDLLPVLVGMVAWGDRWLFDGEARGKLTHVGCGAQVGATLACADGHAVAPDDLELRVRRSPAGPGRR